MALKVYLTSGHTLTINNYSLDSFEEVISNSKHLNKKWISYDGGLLNAGNIAAICEVRGEGDEES